MVRREYILSLSLSLYIYIQWYSQTEREISGRPEGFVIFNRHASFPISALAGIAGSNENTKTEAFPSYTKLTAIFFLFIFKRTSYRQACPAHNYSSTFFHSFSASASSWCPRIAVTFSVRCLVTFFPQTFTWNKWVCAIFTQFIVLFFHTKTEFVVSKNSHDRATILEKGWRGACGRKLMNFIDASERRDGFPLSHGCLGWTPPLAQLHHRSAREYYAAGTFVLSLYLLMPGLRVGLCDASLFPLS